MNERLLLGVAIPLWLLVLLATGCGPGNIAQVSGRVQLADGSPPTGEIRVIRFEPTDDTKAEIRKGAFCDLEDDGSFQLYTRKPGDGVYLGKYAVTFTVFKTAMGRESVIPEKYTLAATTPFVMEVTDDMRDLLFELKP